MLRSLSSCSSSWVGIPSSCGVLWPSLEPARVTKSQGNVTAVVLYRPIRLSRPVARCGLCINLQGLSVLKATFNVFGGSNTFQVKDPRLYSSLAIHHTTSITMIVDILAIDCEKKLQNDV